VPLVYQFAYGVETILTNGPGQEFAVGIFLPLASLVFGTNPCDYAYMRNKFGSSHINYLEINSCFKNFVLLVLVSLTGFLLISKSIVYTSGTLLYSFLFHIWSLTLLTWDT